MARYESSVKEIAAPQGNVYAKLSDLSNLQTVKEKLSDPEAREKMKASGQVTDEQLDQAMRQLETLEFTADTMSAEVPPVGKIAIRIVEREPEKCVKLESTVSPVPVKMWIQLLPLGEERCKMKLTLDAQVNPFLKVMIDKPLRQGIEKVADVLSKIPYNG